MAKNIFERREKKYMMSPAQAEAFLSLVSGEIEPDEYPEADIRSIYYDTPEYLVIQRSIEKPLYKEKLRIRDYGAGSVFVELKKKFDGVVYKRRIEMTHEACRLWLDGGKSFDEAYAAHPLDGREPSRTDMQIAGEVESFRRRFPGLSKAAVVDVFRRSWREIGTEDGVRITMDSNLRFEDLRNPSGFKTLTDDIVMEVKVSGAYPLWLAHALSQLKIFPKSFSKYGNAYKMMSAGGGIPSAGKAVPKVEAFSRVPAARAAAPKPKRVPAALWGKLNLVAAFV